MKIPFGIAQTRKVLRNEIVACQFILRMREFKQVEMRFFIKPGARQQWYKYWRGTHLRWHLSLGTDEENRRYHLHERLVHYADATYDIELRSSFDFKELENIHSRTNFDLGNHEKRSDKKAQYFDPEDSQSFTPYALETSIGLDRMPLAILSNSLQEKTLEEGNTRTVLRLPFVLILIKAAVLSLLKKDGLSEVAEQIVNELKYDPNVTYDEKDMVGERYRRQDAVGAPLCVTIDHQTLEDNTVTLRHRDTIEQVCIAIPEFHAAIVEKVDTHNWLHKLDKK